MVPLEFIKGNNCSMAVLLVTPETGHLPDEMGPLARFISGKSGGLGDVISALSEGLTERGIECHLATLNLSKRFQRENRLRDDEWNRVINTIDPDRIHLVNSAVFEHLPDAYAGNPVLNAAEFQRTLINQIIPRIRAKNGGHLIIHSHDWMAGGIVTAYAKMQGCPVLHTVHNVHTGHIPLDLLHGIDTDKLSHYLYRSVDHGKPSIDCQATAIKNASLINFVGARFLGEIIDGHFADQPIVPPSVRREVGMKHLYGATRVILNAPARDMYPECSSHLVRKYGPKDDVMAAKRENLVAFQRRTGLQVNPDAILLYWPSRLDPAQKGIELLEAIAHRFVIDHGDVQIAIVGNGVGSDRTHEEICGRIAWSSGGKITYQRFSEPLSMLGFAAASDVFGASLYEPCGQIDQVGNLFGATATNRDTGGYHDKIRELALRSDGAPEDSGNGFLFRDYDSGGLWYGLSRAVHFHRHPLEVRAKQIKRIMEEARQRHDLGKMVDHYISAYEELSSGIPLRPAEREQGFIHAGYDHSLWRQLPPASYLNYWQRALKYA
ncbi:MAG: glycogen/starch synthase [Syntrophales bacterium]|nr:glycogen/starch synthase [Syntrophales bacterium]